MLSLLSNLYTLNYKITILQRFPEKEKKMLFRLKKELIFKSHFEMYLFCLNFSWIENIKNCFLKENRESDMLNCVLLKNYTEYKILFYSLFFPYRSPFHSLSCNLIKLFSPFFQLFEILHKDQILIYFIFFEILIDFQLTIKV